MSTIAILTVILYAVGAAQGIVFGSLLLGSRKENKVANKFLAAILFLLAYRLIVQSLRIFGLGHYDTWYYFMLDLSWATGPLIYFYVKALLYPSFQLKKRDYLHFLPVLFQLCFSIFVRLQNLYWEEGHRESLSWLGYWGYVVWMNYSTIYLIASILIILYSRKALQLLKERGKVLEIKESRSKWIKTILSAFMYYFSVVLLILLIDLFIIRVSFGTDYYYFTRFYYYPFFGGISLLTYWIGLEGFRRKDEAGIILKETLPEEKKVQLESIAVKLKKLMEEEELFKDPELSLARTAEKLDVKPYLLTQCLNKVFSLRFNEYVNALRVEKLREVLQKEDSEKYTLLGLALEVGFNSKSSFNRAVKKHLGLSPSELRAKYGVSDK